MHGTFILSHDAMVVFHRQTCSKLGKHMPNRHMDTHTKQIFFSVENIQPHKNHDTGPSYSKHDIPIQFEWKPNGSLSVLMCIIYFSNGIKTTVTTGKNHTF